MVITTVSKTVILGSSPGGPAIWNHGEGVIIPPCHGDVTGSSPVGSANFTIKHIFGGSSMVEQVAVNDKVVGSSPAVRARI